MKALQFAFVALSFLGLSVAAPLASRGDEAVVSLDIYPPEARLTSRRDRQPIVVVATRADGVTIDAAAEAKFTLADPAFARLEGTTLHPQADGKTTLKVEYAGHSREIPVEVAHAGDERPISFRLDVMPVFMRAGCNTGACHGSARGKDGFRLSLFGFDPAGDHYRLTREWATRRVNLGLPSESLMLEKATGAVQHTGGKRIEPGSSYYETLHRWLEAGTPNDPADVATVVGVEIFPPKAVLAGEGTKQQFIARAKYSDGTDRDVTDLAVFLTNNDNSAPIDADGMVTAAARGEAFVMARFSTFTVGSQVIVIPKDANFTPSDEKPANYVDELVGEKLKKLRMLPSPICTDEEFLRRVTIDITGLLPTPDEYRAFVADQSQDKRAKKIDELLERKEFSEIWAMKWSELLMVKSGITVEYKPALLYANWISKQIADDVPLDKMVRELLGATGGTFQNPPTNYYQIERETLKVAENVAQVFLGIRVQCAQCHNHPFDRWTMDDYYGFTAFFAQIGRKPGEDFRENIIYDGGGDVRHPVTGAVVPPKFLGGVAPDLSGKSRRQLVAEWITSPDNPYFAPNVANRVWDHFFGAGIVEPVDDVRISNPASNPELLDTLGKKLVEYNYDFKRLVRDICNSNAYQRSTERNDTNATDELNFAHGNVRRIRAECLLDCVSQITETKDKFRGLPLGSRAVQISDGATSNYFLTTFGRAQRVTVCACEASGSPTLSQALHLLNGGTVETKIRDGKLIERMLDEKKTPEQAIEELYVRCLSRLPTDDERKTLLTLVGDNPRPVAELQDVFWALLNSREFIFNH